MCGGLMPRASRPAGPAATTGLFLDDGIPTRDELLEALVNLRAESDKALAEWQQAVTLNRRESASRAWKRYDSLHSKIDRLCLGVEMYDAIAG